MATLIDPEMEYRLSILTRWYRLRLRGIGPQLLHEPMLTLWTFDNPADPWGSKMRLPFDMLIAIV